MKPFRISARFMLPSISEILWSYCWWMTVLDIIDSFSTIFDQGSGILGSKSSSNPSKCAGWYPGISLFYALWKVPGDMKPWLSKQSLWWLIHSPQKPWRLAPPIAGSTLHSPWFVHHGFWDWLLPMASLGPSGGTSSHDELTMTSWGHVDTTGSQNHRNKDWLLWHSTCFICPNIYDGWLID